MAFTTSGDYSATATLIITEALELIGVLQDGESPSANQSASALRSLNYLIKTWSANTHIWAQGEYTLDLVASTGAYTLSVSNVGYTPQAVVSATRIDSSSEEVSLMPLSQEEWYAIGNKTTTGTPVNYYAQRLPEPTGMVLNIWPIPSDTAYDLNLWLQYPIRDVDAGTDDMWFTQEWYLALSYGLAYLLSFKYGAENQERLMLKEAMDEFRWEAESFQTDGSVKFQPAER